MIRFTGIATLVFLLAAGVPWYWQYTDYTGNEIYFGLPIWFVVSVVVSAIASIATAIQFAIPWPDESIRESTPDSDAHGASP